MTEKYTPDEAELIGCYAGAMEEQAGENYATAKADAERGIAKIKADAWTEGLRAGLADSNQPPTRWHHNPYRDEREAND